MTTETIIVTDEQVAAAQMLLRISGDADEVHPLIRKIAEAEPADAVRPAEKDTV